MSDGHSDKSLVFESQPEKWVVAGRVVLLLFLAFLMAPALHEGIPVLGSFLYLAFVVPLAIILIVCAAKSRHLGGRVMINNGLVRVYKPTRRLVFEAPYSEFEEVQLRYHRESESSGPEIEANLIHKTLKLRKIQLFYKEGDKLDAHDEAAVERVAQEIGIPVVDGTWFFD